MYERLQTFVEALRLLAKKSNEPDALMIMELRIHEYFAGVANRPSALASLREAVLAEAEANPDRHEFWEDVERYADQIAGRA
jgi:hypothetical protein